MNSRLLEIAYPDFTRVERFVPADGNPNDYSGKWRVLNGLLHDWSHENDEKMRSATFGDAILAKELNKVLIFTKSRKLLEYIAWTLQYEGMHVTTFDLQSLTNTAIGFKYKKLHGGVAGPDRTCRFQCGSLTHI